MRLCLARLHLTRKTLLIAGATMLLVGGGGIAAYATVLNPVSSSGVIYGCYANAAVNGSHLLVLQDTGTSCPKGTTAISWSQTGPSGAAGSPGPAGPSGPTGEPGILRRVRAARQPGCTRLARTGRQPRRRCHRRGQCARLRLSRRGDHRHRRQRQRRLCLQRYVTRHVI